MFQDNQSSKLLERDITTHTVEQDYILTNEREGVNWWETAKNWLVKSEEWLQGTFLSIDPEKLTEELQTMWRKVCKFIERSYKIS